MDEPPRDAPEDAGRNPLSQVPVEITIAVGRVRLPVRDMLALAQGAVLPLDRRVEDPVELFVGERLIARGELQEIEGERGGQIGVRLTEVADVGLGL